MALYGSLAEAPGSPDKGINPFRPAWQVDFKDLLQYKSSVAHFAIYFH